MTIDNHRLARDLVKQTGEVRDMRRRASHWRLTDCDVATLERMRVALIEEMQLLKKSLSEADDYLTQCIESSDPLATEAALERINRISAEWNVLNTHLQEIDDAILERHLKTRLVNIYRSERVYYFVEVAILILILAAVLLTIMEMFVPSPPQSLLNQSIAINTVVALILMADFLLRLYLSEDRRWYWGKYWIDFVSSLPFAGVLRFGRLVHLVRFAQLLRLLRLGRALRVLSFTFRGLDQLSKTLQVNLLKRAVMVASLLLILGAFSISAVEQGAVNSAKVDTLTESLWWSFTTVVTGGFADLYNPQTVGGKLLTVGLILLGFTVTSIFTASLTSILIGDDSSRIEQNQHAIEKQLDGLLGQLDLLSKESNSGLIALETVAQQISNALEKEDLFRILGRAMIDQFAAIQTSIHLLDGNALRIVTKHGLDQATPSASDSTGVKFLDELAAHLLQEDLGEFDVEPVTKPFPQVRGVRLALPLVARRQLIGFIHLVLPENLGRYYAYNRAPMTLAHHAALAIADLTD